ncbi:hypothetical protein, partial [Aeromicrobium sp.]|uniref:hypothetical protein n=1 Tax=Aeromicrobium sp. TaxID=1871063 RepID=UPI002FC8613C
LKALAGSNVSRGFESRPLCSMNYRLDRRFVLRSLGINVMTLGTFTVGAFLLPGVWSWLFAGLAVLLLINAVTMAVWPPVVVRTAEANVRVGGRLTVRRISLPWSEVEGVDHADGRLYFTRGDETILSFPLAYVGPRGEELVRDIYDRLNTANGYTRFNPS